MTKQEAKTIAEWQREKRGSEGEYIYLFD